MHPRTVIYGLSAQEIDKYQAHDNIKRCHRFGLQPRKLGTDERT